MRRSVYDAAVHRVRYVFDEFPRVVVSVSGGKDSTCIYHLALDEAKRRGRRFELFFLDQEAEYQSTVETIAGMMEHPLVVPRWYQVPIRMTNATSHREFFLDAWWEGQEWMREKHPLAIHAIEDEYPQRFYDFFAWHEKQSREPTAFLVGLRIFESLDRQRAATKHPGYKGFGWSTKTKSPHAFRFYPIYDWHFRDVWKYIADSGVPYNRMYDRMYVRTGIDLSKMRVSNLIHEKSFRAIAQLQEFEPETYDRLVKRLGGVHCAALYAEDSFVFAASSLPAMHKTWREYRDYLLATTPGDRGEFFRRRFARQGDDEATARQQVKQLLLNDWEGSLQIRRAKASRLRQYWWDRL